MKRLSMTAQRKVFAKLIEFQNILYHILCVWWSDSTVLGNFVCLYFALVLYDWSLECKAKNNGDQMCNEYKRNQNSNKRSG